MRLIFVGKFIQIGKQWHFSLSKCPPGIEVTFSLFRCLMSLATLPSHRVFGAVKRYCPITKKEWHRKNFWSKEFSCEKRVGILKGLLEKDYSWLITGGPDVSCLPSLQRKPHFNQKVIFSLDMGLCSIAQCGQSCIVFCSGTITLGATMVKWLRGKCEAFLQSFQLKFRTESKNIPMWYNDTLNFE